MKKLKLRLPSWALLVYLHGEVALGAKLAFTLLVIVWAADVGAYAFGRTWERSTVWCVMAAGLAAAVVWNVVRLWMLSVGR